MNDPRCGEFDEFDEFHDERLSGLYRATRDAEPPAWLDQRILTAARTGAEPRPAPIIPLPQRRGTRFWALPVALAATVVFAVGLLRLLPPASEPGGMPAALEETALRSLAKPAPEQDAARAKSVESAVADHAPPPVAPAAPVQSAAPATGAMGVAPQSVPASLSAPAARRQEPFHQPAPAEWREGVKTDVRDRADRRPPAEWRAEIAELRRQGRNAEAEARWAEFRRYYPDEPLDEPTEPPR